MPLPKLPTLVPRDTPASLAAERAALAAIEAPPAAPEPAPASAEPAAAPSGGKSAPISNAEIQSLLRKAGDRTGLGDAQLARIAELEATAGRGDQETALVGLLRLNDELDGAMQSYSVGSGESLWQIASKPETYGNANLWPLIWRANPKSLPKPAEVKLGQKLQMPRYPSLAAVSDALEYARTHTLQ